MAAHSIDLVRATAIMEEYRQVVPFDTELPDGWAALLDQLNGQDAAADRHAIRSDSGFLG